MSGDPKNSHTTATPVVGRLEQRSLIAAALSQVSGTGTVTIVGGPGTGKTTLLDAAHDAARAAGFGVLRCTGSRHDRAHQLWHLHEAVYPLLDNLSGLSHRQRTALSTAFSELDGPDPDLPAVGLAVLGLLERAAARRPVVLLVDDWQWLDASSAEVLSFVAGEITRTSVVLLATSRTVDGSAGAPAPETLTCLTPMSECEAEELLRLSARDLSSAERSRILEFAAGNPLALVEYASGPARKLSGFPPTDRLANSFLDEVRTLPESTRLLLLCAAAAAPATTSELVRAGSSMGTGPADARELTRRGLLDLSGERLVLRQPLLAAIVYADAPMTDRIAVHRALARVSGEPLQAARHLAAATPHQDGKVAAALEQAARRATRRGALTEAITVLKWSADLSPGIDGRAERLGDAAELARQAGQTSTTDRLLHEAYAAAGESPDVTTLAITRAGDRSSRGTGAGDVPLLLTLSRRLADLTGRSRTAERVRLLTAAAVLSTTCTQPARVLEEATAELAALDPARWDPVRAAALAILDPLGHGAALRDRLGELGGTSDDPALLSVLGRAAQAVHDRDGAVAVHERSARLLRDGGRSADHAQELLCLSMLRVLSGDLRQASAEACEARRMASALGLGAVEAEAHAVLAVAQAWIGEGTERGDATSPRHEPASWSSTRARRGWASGLTALVQGRYRAAWIDLQAVGSHPVTAAWAVADCAEAAVMSGRAGLVTDQVTAVEAHARTLRSDHLLALTHRARALLDSSANAQGSYEASIVAAERAGSVLEFGRSHLAYGRWLRRRRRIVRSREHLSTAMAVFGTAGAQPWATLAHRELAAAGAGSTRPATTECRYRESLTPQERQVAELAADGLSNREIAAQLLLSHRTIGSHLYRAFAKLSITDRRQVGQALIDAR
ncbi:AAA family ATPase [Actinoplanes sp. M2I2]|uniref:AAA family ATPase n=1 Tax=Actinoplanes sp. M2I2 TaxID=1734444 RepID=UPI0020215725|nr:LuxR family transcriptional regulator [Actinoplanes sp. M2I2]